MGTIIDHGHEEESEGILTNSETEIGLDDFCMDLMLQNVKLSGEHLREKKDKKGRKTMVAKKKKRAVTKKNFLK